MSIINVSVTTQTDITSQNGAEADRKVALAELNGKIYMAYRGWGGSKNMYICSSSDGKTWGSQSSITDSNGAKTQSSPALASLNGRLYLVYQGANSDNLYICSSSDGVNFGSQTEITKQNSAETTSPPALASFNNRLYLAYRGTGLSTSLYVCSSSNGTNWDSQTNVTDQNRAESTTNAGPALAKLGDKLFMGWVGKGSTFINGSAIYVCSSSNGTEWGPQTSLKDANGAEGLDGVSLAATSTTLFAIYHGAHTAQLFGCGFDGSTWSTNQIDFTGINQSGSAWGPALGAMGDSFYTAYPGIGVSNNLWDFTFTTSWGN